MPPSSSSAPDAGSSPFAPPIGPAYPLPNPDVVTGQLDVVASDDSGGVIVAPVDRYSDDVDETSQIPSMSVRDERRRSGWMFWVLPLLILLALIWALLRIFGGDDGDARSAGTTVDDRSLPSLVPGDLNSPDPSAAIPGSSEAAQPTSPPPSAVDDSTPQSASPAPVTTTVPPTSGASAPTAAPVAPVAPGGELVVARVKATCTAEPSTDAQGKPLDFEAPNLVDFAVDTAWRCAGKGIGESITFGFDGPTRVAQVGAIPGWVHTDPSNKDDRYAQNRRLRTVRWDCLDTSGAALTGVEQTFADNREMQNVATPDFAACAAVRMTIGDVTNYRSRNFIAVSDVSLRGA